MEGKDAPSSDSNVLEGESKAETQIAVEANGVFEETAPPANRHKADPFPAQQGASSRARTKLEAAKISLNDCLACSGCVTSAESVLIGMQSLDEVRRIVAENRSGSRPPRTMVASIAPQCLASFSARHSLSTSSLNAFTNSFIPLESLLKRIEFFLRTSFDFAAVTDTTFARHIALREHQREFFERREATRRLPGEPQLPMLSSACPGWICYTEKTHGELLPFVSRTKSPQQVSGLLFKRWYSRKRELQPSSIYHVAVMPCYDKKLEASRPDFYDEILATKDVDCVITTGELDLLMNEEGFDITRPVPSEHHELMYGDGVGTITTTAVGADTDMKDPNAELPCLIDHAGSSSGSYLFNLIKAVWYKYKSDTVFDPLSAPKLDVRIIRSSDFTEYILKAPDDSILFKGANCYGFRNLQNLVRKVQKQTGIKSRKGAAAAIPTDGESSLEMARGQGRAVRREITKRRGMVKRGGAGIAISEDGSHRDIVVTEDAETRGYDYVEVMACPGGCVNGGGQIRPPTLDGNESLKASGISMAISSGFVESTEALVDVLQDTPAPLTNAALAKTSAAKELDPEGYPSGWSTPLSDRSHSQLGAEELPMIQGWQGTSKEWVRRVERAYWKARCSKLSSSCEGDGVVAGSASVSFHPLDSSQQTLFDCLVREDGAIRQHLDSLADRVVVEVIAADQSGSDVDEARKRERFLRTSYHAIQDEAVSGLAVQW